MASPARLPRHQQINIRISDFERDLLDHAARIQGKNRTEFILEAAMTAAQSTIEEQTTIFADEESFAAFVDALDAPVPSTGELKRLFTTAPPWE